DEEPTAVPQSPLSFPARGPGAVRGWGEGGGIAPGVALGLVGCSLLSLSAGSVSCSDSPLPVSSRVCFVKFHDPDSAVVAQHLTNTVFVDRALIVVPYAEGVIPDETKALSLLAPANAVAGLLPGGGLLPTPNPLSQVGWGTPGCLLSHISQPGSNFVFPPQSLAADQLLKLMSTVDPKLNHVAAGLVSPSLKSDTSSKEIEEAMKRVREAQSLISAAIEPGPEQLGWEQSQDVLPVTPCWCVPGRRSRSRSRRRSHSKSRSRRRSKSPRRRRSHSRERSRRSRSTSKTSALDTVPAVEWGDGDGPHPLPADPHRHKKEKKKDKDKERSRDERERSTSKKKKSKDKEKDRDRKSESDKDVKQVTRDYDEEEQGYDSEKEKKEEKKVADAPSPKGKEPGAEKGSGDPGRESKVNGDDHHEEDMDMSD
uniref:Serine and arginine rich splicing factor 11 n=1 Tax=Serinus canaria TaxID=9135 RepID=A0A8C9MXF2_SERCA